ncbi:MAG: small multi-drug export protein [Candidatus Thermoplasmatota archaeon]|nr:small multi-drug export protein [Candidatus Thermoplasmatota archaeon]
MKSTVVTRLIKLFLPILLGVGVFGAIGLLMQGYVRLEYWSLVTGYFFPPLGKESIIPIGVARGFNPILIALSIAFVDVVVAMFLVWNYDLAKKIPILGKFMKKVEEKGRNVEDKYGWIKPLRFAGIVIFVMIPFQGSGGLVASIVGRFVGMKPWNTFIAIAIGAITGCLLVATFSKAFMIFAEINTTLTVILIIILAIILISYFVAKKTKKPKNVISQH